MVISFNIFSNLLFRNHPIIQHFIIWDIDHIMKETISKCKSLPLNISQDNFKFWNEKNEYVCLLWNSVYQVILQLKTKMLVEEQFLTTILNSSKALYVHIRWNIICYRWQHAVHMGWKQMFGVLVACYTHY